MSKTSKRRSEHQAIVAAVRGRQQSKQRRFNILVYGGFGLFLAAIITAVALAVTGSIQERNAAAEAAKKPIDGIQTFPICLATTSRTPSTTRRNQAPEVTMRRSGRTAASTQTRLTNNGRCTPSNTAPSG